MGRRGFAICLVVFAAVGTASFAVAQPDKERIQLGSGPAERAGPLIVLDPVRGYPLATDGLMAPAPAVPPRTAYQRPGPPPDDRANLPEFVPPSGTVIPLPGGPGRFFRYVPRYGRLSNLNSTQLPDGTQRIVFTDGVTVNVSPGKEQPEIEFSTDNAVIWIRGGPAGENLAGGFEIEPGGKREVEVYLAGNVVVRTSSDKGGTTISQTVRANEVYYDVARNRAIAIEADLESRLPQVPDAVHLTGQEIHRLDLENWEILGGSVFSSKLPSDPGLRVNSPRSTLRERRVNLTNVFGIPYRDFDGNQVQGWERILTVRNAVTKVNGTVPVFYWPYLKTDLTEPFGPLVGLGGGMDRIFGTQVYTTWDVYRILALRPPPGHKWRLNLDFLSDRGPAVGTDYNYSLPVSPDLGYSPGQGFASIYGLNDGGVDVIGGNRGPEPTHEALRGRAQWRHQQEIMEGMYFQGQLAYLSDKNFFEQFYKQEFDLGPNQESAAYLTYQDRQLWGSALIMPKIGREWETQTQWLPRLDGALVGQSVFDLFVYTARANAAYALLRPAEINPLPVFPTDQRIDTGRFDLGQEVSLPFDLGPFKFAPYGVLDLAYYTEDLTGEDRGRVYGGGGLRSSLPFSRLYNGASSELFNVRGLYHKAVFGTNYYYARSDTPYSQLPQLDRLNDDTTDRAYRNIRPFQTQFVSGPNGTALATSPLFDAQRYAIRRVVDNRPDTLDDMNVLQADLRQRFQTKRGYPGLEHTVDVATLDLSASYFPEPARDNFGQSFAFLEYGALWNVGDRTSVLSGGWIDPFDTGARYWTMGLSIDRPDRTNFYVSYRQTDPLNSKAVTGSVAYQLSRRYQMGAGVSYDFGIQQALTNSFSLTRTGSDLTLTVGFTYNALVNNFGFQFLLVPNLIAGRVSSPGTGLFGR